MRLILAILLVLTVGCQSVPNGHVVQIGNVSLEKVPTEVDLLVRFSSPKPFTLKMKNCDTGEVDLYTKPSGEVGYFHFEHIDETAYASIGKWVIASVKIGKQKNLQKTLSLTNSGIDLHFNSTPVKITFE